MGFIQSKIKTQKQLKAIVSRLRRQGKRIAFTNGCFDILHYGHAKYLQDAKGLVDILIVGLNSDSSVRKIKGEKRPVNKENDRAGLLCALASVDYLTIFGQETPLKLIKLLRPDILVKGGDWNKNTIVGADFVKSYGAKAVTIPYLKGYSTTDMIDKIKGG